MMAIFSRATRSRCMAESGSGNATSGSGIALRANKTFLFGASLVLLCASGCVDSEVPLSDPENAVADEEVLGLWQSTVAKDRPPLCIEKVDQDGLPMGLMRAFVPDRPSERTFFLWTTRIGDYTLINIPCAESPEKVLLPVDGNNAAEYLKWARAEKRPVLLAMVKSDGDEMLLWRGIDAKHFTGDRNEILATLTRNLVKVFAGEPERFERESHGKTVADARPHQLQARLVLFALREAAQSHLVVEALKIMAQNDVPDEEFDKVHKKLVRGLEGASVPMLKQEIEDNAHDEEAVSLLKEIARLQGIVLFEADAVRRLAIEDPGPKSVMKVVQANLIYEEQVAKIMKMLGQGSER